MASSQSTDIVLRFVPFCPSTRLQRAECAKPADWIQHKDLITRLYLTENKTLPQVQAIMEIDHGFVATRKMWKRKIALWGLDRKNMKHEDGAEILRQVTHLAVTRRPLPEKFVVGDREFDMRRAQQYLLKTRQVNLRRLYDSRRLASAAESSPMPGLSLKTLDPIESLLHILTRWGRSSLEEGLWQVDGTYFRFQDYGNPILNNLFDYMYYSTLNEKVVELQLNPGLAILESRIRNSIPQIVSSADYHTVRSLFMKLGGAENSSFAAHVLQLCAYEARRVFPSCHARVHLFSILARIELQEILLEELVDRLDECVFDTVSSNLGNDHLALVDLAITLQVCPRFHLSKVRHMVTTIIRDVDINETFHGISLLYFLVKGILIPRGELEEASAVSTWMTDRAAERSGFHKTVLMVLGSELEWRTAEAQDNTQAMASSLLQNLQWVRHWRDSSRVEKVNIVASLITSLEGLGESYSELVRDAKSLLNHDLRLYEAASKRAGMSFEEYILEREEDCDFESDLDLDSEEDYSEDSAEYCDYGVGENSGVGCDEHNDSLPLNLGREEGSRANDSFACELPKGWPIVNDVIDCETAFDWALARVERVELAPRCFEMDDILQTENVWEV